MLDGDLKPVLIDFDSCAKEGSDLIKGGTMGWSNDDTVLS